MMWNSNIKFLLQIILVLCLFFKGSDIFPSEVGRQVRYDSSEILLRKVPEEELHKLSQDTDYNYAQEEAPISQTGWERFKQWVWEKFLGLFANKTGNIILQVIKYLLVVSVVVFIIFLLMKNDVGSLFYKKTAMVPTDFREYAENIHEIDFEKRIADEVAKRDFRKAIRLYFLKVIKELNSQNLIAWKLDKTNTDYLNELRSGRYYSQFAELSRLYEYIWYGNFKLDETKFLTIVQKFDQFKINQTH